MRLTNDAKNLHCRGPRCHRQSSHHQELEIITKQIKNIIIKTQYLKKLNCNIYIYNYLFAWWMIALFLRETLTLPCTENEYLKK